MKKNKQKSQNERDEVYTQNTSTTLDLSIALLKHEFEKVLFFRSIKTKLVPYNF